MPAPNRWKCPDGHEMLSTNAINKRLGPGVQLTSTFIEVELGVGHREQDRRALLWWERDYKTILVKLTEYFKEKQQ